MKTKKKIFIIAAIFLLFAVVAIADKWSTYGTLSSGNIADTDTFLMLDVSDTSMAATGTQKQYTWATLKADILSYLGTATLNFGGATLEVPNSDDPDISVTGQISFDTDGWLRVYNNTRQEALARVQEEIHVTVVKPQDMADAVRDAFLVWSNESGMTFTVTGWKAWAGTDNTTLNIEETDADGQNNATVDAVEIATNGTGVFTASDTTITGPTIENGHLIWLDFDDTDDPSYVKLTIYGYYNADVN